MVYYKKYINVKRLSCYDSITPQLKSIYQVNIRISAQRIHTIHHFHSVSPASASVANPHPTHPILRLESLELLIRLFYSTYLALPHNPSVSPLR